MFRRYRHLVVFDPHPSPTADQLAAVERATGVAIPATLAAFWSVANGGILEYGLWLDAGGRAERRFVSFSSLFTVSDVPAEIAELGDAWFRGRLPPRLTPIARTGGEDDFLFVDGSDGAVCAWISGRPAWAGGSENDCLYRLAPTLDAYLDRLLVLESDALDAWRSAETGATPEGLADVTAWLDAALPDWRAHFG
jgi:hypothetical protein